MNYLLRINKILTTFFAVWVILISVIAYFIPSVSVLAIMAIIACVVALNVKNILAMGGVTLLAVIFHNILGLLSGYSIAYLFKQNIKNCRAIFQELFWQAFGAGNGNRVFARIAL